MKRKRSMVLGVLCGIACALCVGLYLMQVSERADAVRAEALERYGGEQIEVCVAKRDIAPGETLTDGAIETKMWVAALLPEGAVTDPGEVTGKVAATSVLAGEVILAQRFDAKGASLEVPSGFAAVSVPAREVQAIGGALVAGMKTDVYAIGPSTAERILVRASVLATSAGEGTSGMGSAAITWVTLAVAPEKVQEVIAAAENLELYFVLPSQDEQEGSVDPEALRSRVLDQKPAAGEESRSASAASADEGSQREGASEALGSTRESGAVTADSDQGRGTSWIR